MKVPAELLYSSDHGWVKVEDNLAIIGITDFAQDQLGKIKKINFPEIGDFFESGEELCKIEAAIDFTDVYAPVSGYVAEINTELLDEPELMNEDSYGKGWLVVLEISDSAETDDLMSADEYNEFLDEES